jgi:hypothetical protein
MADDIHTIPERTTQKYSFTLQDEDAASIPGPSLDTCTLTLYDLASEAIINSRDHVDIKANVDGAGRLTFTFTPADNQVLDDSHGFEPHVALFEWTYNSPTGRGQWQLVLNVANAEKVPA